jgi:hypothetical protein
MIASDTRMRPFWSKVISHVVFDLPIRSLPNHLQLGPPLPSKLPRAQRPNVPSPDQIPSHAGGRDAPLGHARTGRRVGTLPAGKYTSHARGPISAPSFCFPRYRVNSTRAACQQVVGHTKAIGNQLEMNHIPRNHLPTLIQAGA